MAHALTSRLAATACLPCQPRAGQLLCGLRLWVLWALPSRPSAAPPLTVRRPLLLASRLNAAISHMRLRTLRAELSADPQQPARPSPTIKTPLCPRRLQSSILNFAVGGEKDLFLASIHLLTKVCLAAAVVNWLSNVLLQQYLRMAMERLYTGAWLWRDALIL